MNIVDDNVIVDCLPLCHLPVSINNFNKNEFLSLDGVNGENTKIVSLERPLLTSTELNVVCGIRDTHTNKKLRSTIETVDTVREHNNVPTSSDICVRMSVEIETVDTVRENNYVHANSDICPSRSFERVDVHSEKENKEPLGPDPHVIREIYRLTSVLFPKEIVVEQEVLEIVKSAFRASDDNYGELEARQWGDNFVFPSDLLGR